MSASLSVAAPPPESSPRAAGWVPNPIDRTKRVQAVLFDLDGTLYDQMRMRRTMAAELLKLPLRHPTAAVRVWRVLSAYRRAQEVLRQHASPDFSSTTQYEHAATASGVPVAAVQRIVDEWMFQRPLRHMMRCRAGGLVALLTFLRDRNVLLGVLSDYAAAEKLRALGVADYFSIVLCATDPQILAFKPRPNGFLEAARRWDLAPSEVLMIGDRADSDGAGARAANMPCVILAQGPSTSASFYSVSSLERLRDVLDDNGR
jgi:FMN phosphatase YigB (HAD superfamily)